MTWFQYDQETGKVKNGIPIVLRNAGPDAYATAQATIQAQGGVRFDAAPKECVKVSDTKLTCASNGSTAEKGEEIKLVIPATISGKRQAFVVDFTGTGAVDRDRFDNENVVMQTAFDVKPSKPTTPPTTPAPSKPADSAAPVPPAQKPEQPGTGKGELAETGGDNNSAAMLGGGAALLLAVGGGSVLFARRRRTNAPVT
ncbi:LAETG motif-containing sortase-dependent surface protein [Embleya sp. NBC_00888]|uniref:LAETG motif-containing sortase-dependent surface protein n=1 Tax=Embleya sp. NBC_00888 TaxID=2975960 RepID=UPI00386FEA05